MGAAKAADALSRAPAASRQRAPINADSPFRFRRRDITTSPGRYNGGIDQGGMPMDNNLDAINHAKNELIDLAMRFGPKVLVALLILIAGAMTGRWVGRALERGLARMEFEPPVRLLMVRLLRVLVFALFA